MGADRRQIVAINRIPNGYTIYPTGEASDITNGTWQGGTELRRTTTGTMDFQMLEHWYAIGGRGNWEGGKSVDKVSAWLVAPATTGTSNPGAGAYDKVSTGAGSNIFVPAPLVDGDWDLNLTEKLNANVNFTKAAPVKNAAMTGFFDYDYDTHTLSLNSDQKGKFDLYDTQCVMFTFANQINGVEGEIALDVSDVVGKVLLPHWIIRFKAEVVTGSAVCSVNMITAVKSNVDGAHTFGAGGWPWA
jgi:hypothetical protein